MSAVLGCYASAGAPTPALKTRPDRKGRKPGVSYASGDSDPPARSEVSFNLLRELSQPGGRIRYNGASDPDKRLLDGLSEKLCSSPPLSQFTQKFTDHNFFERGMLWNSYAYTRLDRFVRPQAAIVVRVKPSAAASTSSPTRSTSSSERHHNQREAKTRPALRLLATKVGMPHWALKKCARELGLARTKELPWGEAELRILARHW